MADLKVADIPPFSATSIDAIVPVHQRIVTRFNSHTTRPIEYRLTQLRKLYWALKDAEPALFEACQLDLGKGTYETYLTEVGWVLNDILFMVKNLARFMREEKAEDTSLTNMAMSPRIRKEPLGAVLVIGAYNFPLQLSLGPLVGAIAAGCTAVLKPSENAPHAARVMQYAIERSLDPEAFQVVQGGVPETTALLDQKWDKIFYTGGVTVGRIIARKAAETLTPVTLELGGRNPAIVTKHADLRLAARRLLWAKLVNVGQVCVSQNYILVDEEVLPAFLAELKKAFADFQPTGAENSAEYGHIINERQWQRLADMIANTSGKILHGGQTNRSTLFIAPTVIQVSDPMDPLLTEESFGPLIPILPVPDLDTAIRTANAIHATPLGLYAFGSKAETARILDETRSGGASLNDGFFHASIPTLAFGGVGDSGQGAYRGRASFDCFTHRRSVTRTPAWMEGLLDVRYPPFTAAKLKRMKGMVESKPDFDRQGRKVRSWGELLFGLGAQSRGGVGLRWAVLLFIAAYLTKGRTGAKL